MSTINYSISPRGLSALECLDHSQKPLEHVSFKNITFITQHKYKSMCQPFVISADPAITCKQEGKA